MTAVSQRIVPVALNVPAEFVPSTAGTRRSGALDPQERIRECCGL